MSGLTFANVVNNLVGMANALIPALVALSLLLFFAGIVQYVYNAGDTHANQAGKELIIWGLVAMFVLMSLWGILDVAKRSLFG